LPSEDTTPPVMKMNLVWLTLDSSKIRGESALALSPPSYFCG